MSFKIIMMGTTRLFFTKQYQTCKTIENQDQDHSVQDQEQDQDHSVQGQDQDQDRFFGLRPVLS